VLIFISAVTVFCLFQIVRGKGRPEEIILPSRSPPKVFGLLPVGVAMLLLFSFSRDTASYWRLAATLLWLLIGAFVLLGPSYSQLSDSQRALLAGSVAKAWWVFPASLAVFLIGLVVLALLAPGWTISAFITACLCGFAVEIALFFLMFRKVLRRASE
jgi:hypothetical protein